VELFFALSMVKNPFPFNAAMERSILCLDNSVLAVIAAIEIWGSLNISQTTAISFSERCLDKDVGV